MPPKPRPNIAALEPAVHGGIDYEEMARLGISPEAVLDFSVSTNPCGPPPGIREALAKADLASYPDSQSLELRHALSESLGVPEKRIIVGSGSTEIIRMAATAYLGAGDKALVPQPTYVDYEVACQLVGARVVARPWAKGDRLQIGLDDILAQIAKEKPKAIFVCNPNNPTGQYLSRQEVEAILDAAPQALVVLDEAYAAFLDGAWPSLDLVSRGNLLVIRSMTKDYALAGVRLGYGVANEDIITILHRVQPPWSVNAVAQQAGLVAVSASGYIERCRREVNLAKEYLFFGLRALGLEPLASSANYFLVKIGDAGAFRKQMLARGILVRDCTSFGLPQYIRLGVRSMEECRRLIEDVKALRSPVK